MRLIGRFTSRGFARSVAVLASGTAVAQLIGVAASPVLTRVYTPEAFGVFGVFLAVVSISSVAVGLRYEAAIPLARGNAEALAVIVLALAVIVGLSVAAGLAIWLIGSLSVGSTLGQALTMALWFVPLALFLSGIHQVLTFWAIRTEAFAESARASVAQSAVQTAAQVALGAVRSGMTGLTIGYVMGRATGVAFLLPTIGSVPRALIRGVRLRELREAAAAFRRFPLIAVWSSLLNSASFQVPVLLLAGLFQATVVGWFLLTVRVLQLPLAVVGTAVGQVFYSRASQASGAELRSITNQVFRTLTTIGTGPMVVLALGGERAFALVFGDEWRGAGEYAQWLAPWLLFVFVASPLSTLVFVLSRQRDELLFQLALGSVRTAALLVGSRLGDADLAIGLFGASSAALWGIYLTWLMRISGASSRASIAHMASNLAVALVLASPVLVANIIGVSGLAWAAVVAVVLGVMILRSAVQIDVNER